MDVVRIAADDELEGSGCVDAESWSAVYSTPWEKEELLLRNVFWIHTSQPHELINSLIRLRC